MDSVAVVVLLELIGDTALREYAQKGGTLALALGFGFYNYMLTWWIKVLKRMPLAMGNAQWDGWSSLVTALWCQFGLKEELTIRQWIGVYAVGLGLMLLGM
jgi:multidrug transporter EmrE-like cation transporter